MKYFPLRLVWREFRVAGLHIIGHMEMESEVSDTFNDTTSSTMALLCEYNLNENVG